MYSGFVAWRLEKVFIHAYICALTAKRANHILACIKHGTTRRVKSGDYLAVFNVGAALPSVLYALLDLIIEEGCEGP